jgi:hypothetical protein
VLGGTCARGLQWLGGEFLFGTANSFRRLSAVIAEIWPTYLENVQSPHHVGDAMLISTAATRAELASLAVLDGGKLGVIARWCSSRTRHRQPAFADIKSCSILRFPSDKEFLAAWPTRPFHPSAFMSAFEKAVGKKLLARRIANTVQTLLLREPKYVPTLR